MPQLEPDGRALTAYRRHHVGFVFQFYNLIPSLTALENVALVTEISENPLEPEVALELVELTNRKDHFPAQLSGGEQQRVAIARPTFKPTAIERLGLGPVCRSRRASSCATSNASRRARS